MIGVDHRSIAVSTYSACWDLLESERSSEDDRDLLSLAFTSRYHWLQAGGAMQWATADWMVSRCAAAIGEGSLSMTFAKSALEGVPEDAPAWMRASMHEGMARACVAIGDDGGRVRHIAQARKILISEPSQEDRELIESQIATV
ncbi:MAG: hypothetical protein ACYC06_07940 [Ilumatobacteraceae bacterium]